MTDHFWQAIICGLAIAVLAVLMNFGCVFLLDAKWALIGVAAGVMALVVAWWSASCQFSGVGVDTDMLSLCVSGLVLISYLSAFVSVALS